MPTEKEPFSLHIINIRFKLQRFSSNKSFTQSKKTALAYFIFRKHWHKTGVTVPGFFFLRRPNVSDFFSTFSRFCCQSHVSDLPKPKRSRASERVTLLEKLNKMVSKITTRSTKDLFCSNWNFFENFAAVKFLAKNFFSLDARFFTLWNKPTVNNL